MKIPCIDANRDPATGALRPRFNPSPRLRRLGFTRRNLRHDNGDWYTEGEALDFLRAIEAQADAKEAAMRRGMARLPAARRDTPPRYTMQLLFAEYLDPRINPRMREEGEARGKMARPGLAARTLKDYRQKARVLETGAPEAWALPVAALDPAIVHAMFEDLWARRGLASARGAIAVLSAAISWGIRRGRIAGLAVNPCIGVAKTMPPPRLRAGTPAEIGALIAAADAIGRPEIADMICLGVWTGQRQGDRRMMQDRGLDAGRRLFRQGKTGAIVAIRESPELEARLRAARRRREVAGIIDPHVVLDEKRWKPFTERHYNTLLQAVKAEAAKAVPSVLDLRDQDFRDTAVTWMARGGATIPEICAITGHSLESATQVLRHYLEISGDLADTGMAKMIAWYEEAGR